MVAIHSMLGMEFQPAEIQQTLLIPSDIAKRTGLKNARPINVKLIELGLQTKHRDHKNCIYYQLTEKGIKYDQYQDFITGKMTRRNIKWYDNILELFQSILNPAPLLQLF